MADVRNNRHLGSSRQPFGSNETEQSHFSVSGYPLLRQIVGPKSYADSYQTGRIERDMLIFLQMHLAIYDRV